MRLLRILLLAVVRHSFSQHVQGVTNQSADARSHCRWQESRQLAPNTQPCPASMLSPLVLLTDLTSLIRTAVLLLSCSWPSSLDSAFLCVSPREIHFLLLTAWQLAPIRPVPERLFSFTLALTSILSMQCTL